MYSCRAWDTTVWASLRFRYQTLRVQARTKKNTTTHPYALAECEQQEEWRITCSCVFLYYSCKYLIRMSIVQMTLVFRMQLPSLVLKGHERQGGRFLTPSSRDLQMLRDTLRATTLNCRTPNIHISIVPVKSIEYGNAQNHKTP